MTQDNTTMIFLTTKEAAAYLHKSPITLHEWRWRGIGPTYVKGRPILYLKADLDAFLLSRRVVMSGEAA